ncbi:MAG TPA: hypothetical protein VNU95_01275 [Candidatus Acidoferrales bacterium]|jgi:hypothetical protein|nr:hypothetical protein [Candidatus Acidoferrales bacterium]
MESFQRGALSLVRLVAACLIMVGLLDVCLYLTKCFTPHHRVPVNYLIVLLDFIPGLIGITILVKAKAIAEWLSDMME